MFMFVCKLGDGRILLERIIDFEDDADYLIGMVVSRYGADYLGTNGVSFEVEPAA